MHPPTHRMDNHLRDMSKVDEARIIKVIHCVLDEQETLAPTTVEAIRLASHTHSEAHLCRRAHTPTVPPQPPAGEARVRHRQTQPPRTACDCRHGGGGSWVWQRQTEGRGGGCRGQGSGGSATPAGI